MKNPECIYIPKEYFSYFKQFLDYSKKNSDWFNTYNVKIKTCWKLFLFSKFLESHGEEHNPSELIGDGNKVMQFFTLSNLTDEFLNYGTLETQPEDYPDADQLLFINKRPLLKKEVDLEKEEKEEKIRIKIFPFDLKGDFKIHQKNLKTLGSQINYSKFKRMVERNKELEDKNFHHLIIPLNYYEKFTALINEFKEKNPFLKLSESKKMDNFEINTLKAKSNFGSIDW